jgi:hypothetical protein
MRSNSTADSFLQNPNDLRVELLQSVRGTRRR